MAVMAAPTVGVCSPWISPEEFDAYNCCNGLIEPVDATLLSNAILMASNLLFRLTGRQWPGECPIVVRPCSASGCNGCANGGWSAGAGWSSWWWNSAAGAWGMSYPFTSGELLNGLCGCAGRCELSSVILPNPVAEVTEVIIDGVVLDPTAYRVVNFRRLERLDGGHWPCSNAMDLDSAEGGDVGTWQISEIFGRGPGDDGKLYAAMLACQFALGMCGSASCVLPERTARIVREGVTLEMLDPIALFNQGLTGLPMVDAWIRSVNPGGIARRAHFRRLGDQKNNFQTST